ncbi:unnamed protein product [Phytomonas sp. Hart1]|nr:unnamed protein product [Phytomonas sp. Hart1]|eukprot:CCW69540.1 unnamed protein product [Phytomonas sp. isolate Hart1]
MTRRHAKRERERFIVLYAALRISIEQTRQQPHYLPEEFILTLIHTSKLKDTTSSLPQQLGNGILSCVRSQLVRLGGLRYADPATLVLYEAVWEEASTVTHSDAQVVDGVHSEKKDLSNRERPDNLTPPLYITGTMKIILHNQGVHGKAAEQLFRAVSACIREVPVIVMPPTRLGPKAEKEDCANSSVGGEKASLVTGHRINSIPLRLLVALRVLKYQ